MHALCNGDCMLPRMCNHAWIQPCFQRALKSKPGPQKAKYRLNAHQASGLSLPLQQILPGLFQSKKLMMRAAI